VVTARYAGDAAYPAASGTFTQVVNPAGAFLTLSSSAASPVYGQSVALIARLAAQSGNVSFSEGGSPLGSSAITGGVATLAVTLAPGTHTITASWAGDASWGAASANLAVTVGKAGTATSLLITGGRMQATVSVVAPGAGVTGGSVRFLDAAAGTALATVPLEGGLAVVPLPATANAVVAVYAGDDNFLGSISPTVALLAVTNAASYATGSLAPDELIALFAPELALDGTTATISDGAGKLVPVPLLFVTAAQAAAVVPSGVAPGPATLVVKSGSRTLSAPVQVAAAAPGIFTIDSTGSGAPAAQVLRVHADGSQDDPRPATEPIDLGGAPADVYVVLYATGMRHAGGAPVCRIGGLTARVVYLGAHPDFPGLDQVNILLPGALRGAGSVTLILTADGVESNPVALVVR
jgi:uncharacterized protein (TIGR03437 family)